MEIEIFDSKSIKHRRVNGAALSVNVKGRFEINKTAVETLNLEDGCKISFVHDKKNPRDWYLFRDPNGVTTRVYSKTGSLLFNSMQLRKLIYESIGSPEAKNGKMRFSIATQPTQHKEMIMYAILTSKLL